MSTKIVFISIFICIYIYMLSVPREGGERKKGRERGKKGERRGRMEGTGSK